MRQLYFECYAGVSGDMTVAALLDLGADENKLREALASLPVSGYSVKISRVNKSGLDACDFDVILDEGCDNHDHDMEYLYGHEHGHIHGEHGHEHPHGGHGHEHPHGEHGHEHPHGEHGHEHPHGEHGHEHSHGEHGYEHPHEEHGYEHPHEHTKGHGHAEKDPLHEHDHVHRNLSDILGIIEGSGITPGAKKLASDIFGVVAEAEAKAHGIPVEEVHFHEVGAVDSIVDVVAAAVCLDDLGMTSAVVSAVSEGRGTVRCQHGIIPVPVPAVVNIFAANSLEMHLTEVQGELVTPTGAAIMAVLSKGEKLPDKYRIMAVGLGAGKREYPSTSGIVRAMLIEDAGSFR